MKIVQTLILISLLFTINLSATEYSFRKYSHVKEFYREVMPLALDVADKYQLPAAAILAIAGLESGYGSGYVSQITGNILSLGAFKSDSELPILYLPYSRSKKRVLFDPKEINSSIKDDLSWKNRPRSYKRDYRPAPYAGSKTSLELLKYNPSLKKEAYKACLNDFATRWIVEESNIKVFRDTRVWLNKTIKEKNNNILFSMNTNIGFIEKVGGVPNSFNYRETWPKKVKLIMNRTGLVQLVNDIKNKKMSFNEAWRNNEPKR